MSQFFPAAPASHGLVLVIDDQLTNVRLLTLLLTNSGYTVVSALSGSEGLELARSCHPDVVLLDMLMPGMDGFDVLEGIRSQGRLQDLPVIFLTANNDRESLVRAFEKGATDFLTKPFISHELLARVRTHADLKQSRDALRRVERDQQEVDEGVSRDLRERFAEIKQATELQCALPDASTGLISLAQSIRGSADAGLLFLQALLKRKQAETGPPRPVSSA